MLLCPYCNQEVIEDAPSCPGCQFESAKLIQLLGPAPTLLEPVNDWRGIWKPKEIKALIKKTENFHYQFPKTNLFFVARSFPEEFPMKVCLFHFFNSTGLTELSKRLGQNQNILIGFDPDNRRLGIIVGYGLEAYLVPHELDHILAQAEVALTQNGYYKAASLMIKTLQEKLTKIAIEIPDAYGLDNVDVLQSEY